MDKLIILLFQNFDDIKQIVNDQNYEGNKELPMHKLLQVFKLKYLLL